jgi:hypothetical protein
MKYAVEMGSGPMIHITETHRQHGDLISLLLFFHNKESTLKNGLLGQNFHITD